MPWNGTINQFIVPFQYLFLLVLTQTKIRILEKVKACSSVDRASDSDSESQGFDSLHAYSCWEKGNSSKLGLLWFRHLKITKVWCRSKLVFFVKIYKFNRTANNIIPFHFQTVNFNSSNLLQFAV